jgi:Flp pilus assembly protein TadB
MRWLGIIMAAVGIFAVVVNLLLGNPWIVPYLVWGGVGVVGVVLAARNPKEPKQKT